MLVAFLESMNFNFSDVYGPDKRPWMETIIEKVWLPILISFFPPRACHNCALNHPITIVSIFVCVSVFFAVEASDDDSEGSKFGI